MLAAAYVADVDRLFCLGGALAVAAFAYGTASVPRVDKIVGAGGLFTTIAKRQVFGHGWVGWSVWTDRDGDYCRRIRKSCMGRG